MLCSLLWYRYISKWQKVPAWLIFEGRVMFSFELPEVWPMLNAKFTRDATQWTIAQLDQHWMQNSQEMPPNGWLLSYSNLLFLYNCHHATYNGAPYSRWNNQTLLLNKNSVQKNTRKESNEDIWMRVLSRISQVWTWYKKDYSKLEAKPYLQAQWI